MAREPNAPLLPSLLDRMIDRQPHIRTEAEASRAQSYRELKEAVRRDLEWLLNTRRTPEEVPTAGSELARSVYNYGLPDFSNAALNVVDDRRRIARLMETTIGYFEPRLTNIQVTVQEAAAGSRLLLFHIEGALRMSPAPQRVFFDAKLELTNRQYRIDGDARAQ
jgi:type VI secretion system protein ImpF